MLNIVLGVIGGAVLSWVITSIYYNQKNEQKE